MSKVIDKLRKEANATINRAQRQAINLYALEEHADKFEELLEISGDSIFSMDYSYYKGFFLAYFLKKDEGYRCEKVQDMLNWCLDNLDYTEITESTSEWDKTWKFTCGDVVYRINIDHTKSTKCTMVETGEFKSEPVMKLVCD